MKIRLPWPRQKNPPESAAQNRGTMLATVKSRWNAFNATEKLWETGYINRAASEGDHYREGIWDFAYYILNPVVSYIRPESDVLEIGVGLGRLAACAARAFRHLYGIDISETVLVKARRHLEREGLTNFTLKSTPGDSIPFPDESIDYCYSFLVFQHIPAHSIVENYVREIFRLLRPSGICRIQLARAQSAPQSLSAVDPEWTIDQRCTFDERTARAMFESAGFAVLAVDSRSPKHPWSKEISDRQLWVTAQKR